MTTLLPSKFRSDGRTAVRRPEERVRQDNRHGSIGKATPPGLFAATPQSQLFRPGVGEDVSYANHPKIRQHCQSLFLGLEIGLSAEKSGRDIGPKPGLHPRFMAGAGHNRDNRQDPGLKQLRHDGGGLNQQASCRTPTVVPLGLLVYAPTTVIRWHRTELHHFRFVANCKFSRSLHRGERLRWPMRSAISSVIIPSRYQRITRCTVTPVPAILGRPPRTSSVEVIKEPLSTTVDIVGLLRGLSSPQ